MLCANVVGVELERNMSRCEGGVISYGFAIFLSFSKFCAVWQYRNPFPRVQVFAPNMTELRVICSRIIDAYFALAVTFSLSGCARYHVGRRRRFSTVGVRMST
ncbi:unnamed protein product [Sphacelaria rigidula]